MERTLKAKFNTAIQEIVDACTCHDGPPMEFTLAELLDEMVEMITKKASSSVVRTALNKYCNERTDNAIKFFTEICAYCNSTTEPAQALIKIIDGKVNAEEGKGVSAHDLTDELYNKIQNSCTKDEVKELLKEWAPEAGILDNITRSVVQITNSEEIPEGLKDGGILLKVVPIE